MNFWSYLVYKCTKVKACKLAINLYRVSVVGRVAFWVKVHYTIFVYMNIVNIIHKCIGGHLDGWAYCIKNKAQGLNG